MIVDIAARRAENGDAVSEASSRQPGRMGGVGNRPLDISVLPGGPVRIWAGPHSARPRTRTSASAVAARQPVPPASGPRRISCNLRTIVHTIMMPITNCKSIWPECQPVGRPKIGGISHDMLAESASLVNSSLDMRYYFGIIEVLAGCRGICDGAEPNWKGSRAGPRPRSLHT
jgi:hypothetical protein